MEFDHSGDFLATGDQGGRVVLFERIAASRAVSRRAAAGLPHRRTALLAAGVLRQPCWVQSKRLTSADGCRSPCSARATPTCAPSRRCTPTRTSSAT